MLIAMEQFVDILRAIKVRMSIYLPSIVMKLSRDLDSPSCSLTAPMSYRMNPLNCTVCALSHIRICFKYVCVLAHGCISSLVLRVLH